MKLTCVTAVFNAIKSGNRENLIRCVRSVAALKTEHEHLIYDGGSTDGTVELLRELEKKIGVENRCTAEGGEKKVGQESRSTADGLGSSVDAFVSNASDGNGRSSADAIETIASTGGGESGALIERALPENDNSATSRFSLLTIHSSPDTGIYNALNKGVRDAKGEWFYVLGCDDYIRYPERMDADVKELDDGCDMLVSTVERDDGSLYFENMAALGRLAIHNCYSHQGVIMRTSLVRNLGGFDETNPISADYDMFWKAHRLGVRFKYLFEPFAVYSRGGFSSDHQKADLCDQELLMRHLGATRWEVEKRSERSYRFATAIRLFKYKDLAIRICARHLIYLRLRFYVRTLLYPLVVATRPLRVKHLKEGS